MMGMFHSIQSLSAVRATVFEVNQWLSIIKTRGTHHRKSSIGRRDISAMSYDNELSYTRTHKPWTQKEHVLILWGHVHQCIFSDSTQFYHPPTFHEMIKWEERVFAALNGWAMNVFPAVPTEVLTQPRTHLPWKGFILRMKKINNPDI